MSALDQLHQMPTQGVALPHRGFVRYRELMGVRLTGVRAQLNSMHSTPWVLLHGIGSGSGSWLQQLQCEDLGHVLAWDAPGYADSSPLPMALPSAAEYAEQLWAWLDALEIDSVRLVGHSLGCIMAAAAARLQSSRVKALTLLAPAQGYGTASLEIQKAKRDERLQAMQQLGVAEMARQRAPRLLALQASSAHVALATHMMSQLNEGGYAQATHMLSTANIRADLQAFQSSSAAPLTVACGDADTITPPAACQALAAAINSPYVSLAGAGHLCAMEAAQQVNDLLMLKS